jgi:hypothetical protein
MSTAHHKVAIDAPMDRLTHECQYCGFKSSNGSMERNGSGWYCRNELPCFNRLLRQNKDRQKVIRCMTNNGDRMAHLCFNLSHKQGCILNANVAELMRELYTNWDLAKRGRTA